MTEPVTMEPNGASRSVLFINRVYPPAEGATGEMLSDLAAGLVGLGWTVHVLTGPAAGEPARKTTADGVTVHRVQGLPFSRSSHLRRAVAYCSLYPRFFTRALRLPRVDVIVTKTDPPMLKVLGPLLGRLTGAHTVHWAQDLYPEIAEALGVIAERGLLAGCMRRLSTWALREHHQIVSVGRCMRNRIGERGIATHRIAVVPNWPPWMAEPTMRQENGFRSAHGLDGRFVVMYSGNMGLAHPFQHLLDAAERLAGRAPDVQFVLVGKGPRRAWIEQQVRERELSNVTLLPFQPKERLAESLSAADLHLVTMRPEAAGLVVPSKVYGVLAAGRPCLFLGPPDSEVARVIEHHDTGEVVSDPAGHNLACSILAWREHPERRRKAGARARAAVRGVRERAVMAFDDVLWAALARKQQAAAAHSSPVPR